jgi:hypothetical protein
VPAIVAVMVGVLVAAVVRLNGVPDRVAMPELLVVEVTLGSWPDPAVIAQEIV